LIYTTSDGPGGIAFPIWFPNALIDTYEKLDFDGKWWLDSDVLLYLDILLGGPLLNEFILFLLNEGEDNEELTLWVSIWNYLNILLY